VEEARLAARAGGEKIVADAELAANHGFAAGANAVTELSADPFRMVVNPRPVFPPIDEPLEIRLEEVPLTAPKTCEALREHTGFRLLRIDGRDGQATRILHEDATTPASRGCPYGYRIGGIQTFFPQAGEPVYAVLIAIRTHGFEGPDHSWMAVTRPFSR
jgi:predicted secreted protein